MAAVFTLMQNQPLIVLGLIGLLIFAVVHIVWYIRPSDVTRIQDVNRIVANGKPTIIEFYTNL